MNIKKIYVVSIGISPYLKLRSLSCAAYDASDLAEVLQGGASPVQTRLQIGRGGNETEHPARTQMVGA